MKKLILLFLLLVPLAFAQENYNGYSSLDLSVEISSSLEIVELSNPSFNYLDLELALFPKESERQTVRYLKPGSDPVAGTNMENTIKFRWMEYSNKMEFSLKSDVETENVIYEIPLVAFPLESVPGGLEDYLLPTEVIDITPGISSKASSLVEQEDDLFSAVYELANWVNENIAYNLNTLTAESSQKSSWVFKNKKGVCDEITNLFISMSRSVGIPARFIGGVAYSNLNYSFENHGWAEIYFPGVGWVPYDVTFGQYAWISPDHVELSKSFGPEEPSVSVSASSRGLEILSKQPDIETEIEGMGSLVGPLFDISLVILKNNVAPGSYVPLKVSVKNPLNHYISATVFVTTAPGLIESNLKTVGLGPYEEKDIFWIAIIPTSGGFSMYETKLEVVDVFGSSASGVVTYSKDFNLFSKSEAESLVSSLEGEESSLLSVSCVADEESYYDFEDVSLSCSLKNLGEGELDLEVCFGECMSISLVDEEKIIFELEASEVPENRILSIKGDVELNKYVLVRVYEPKIKISEIEVPSRLDYSSVGEVSFSLFTEAELKNVELKLNGQVIMTLDEFEGGKPVKVSAPGKSLISGVKVEVSYEDNYGNEYVVVEEKEVSVMNVPFYAKFFSFLRNLF